MKSLFNHRKSNGQIGNDVKSQPDIALKKVLFDIFVQCKAEQKHGQTNDCGQVRFPRWGFAVVVVMPVGVGMLFFQQVLGIGVGVDFFFQRAAKLFAVFIVNVLMLHFWKSN